MQNWYQLFTKNTGLSIYVWLIFCLLPFYFVISSSSLPEIVIGVMMILMFFIAYRLSFIKKGWTVYVSVAIEMAISIGMTLYFGYIYFSLFIAIFIGNIRGRPGFISIYIVHLVTTILSVILGFIIQKHQFIDQLPFIVISVIGVILIPVNMFSRNKQVKLEKELENANQRIAQLMVIEERARIARDLHDTLGQKLSLIGLKSDLAGRILDKDQNRAKIELQDIQQTARTALKEVREMVANMKSTKLSEELTHIQQVMDAAEMEYKIEGNPDLSSTPLFIENVLSMCLKEAITNVVKHSNATKCKVQIIESQSEVVIKVKDNGIGNENGVDLLKGHGITGMKERLEFVNGSIEINTDNGTVVTIKVPHFVGQT